MKIIWLYPTGLEIAESEQVPVVAVGTDRLAGNARANDSNEMFMQWCSSTLSVFNIHNIQQAIGNNKNHLLFLHAISGCHTVSAMYKQGKRKAFHMVHKKQDYDLLDTFL